MSDGSSNDNADFGSPSQGRIPSKFSARWSRSSRCSQAQCVEVRRIGDIVEVRDSKQADLGTSQPVLSFTPQEWTSFVDGLKAGDFGL